MVQIMEAKYKKNAIIIEKTIRPNLVENNTKIDIKQWNLNVHTVWHDCSCFFVHIDCSQTQFFIPFLSTSASFFND